MRKTILIAVLGASGFAAVACAAQSTPQTAAQANAEILDQNTPAPAPMPPRGGRGEGRGGGGMMRADANGDGVITRAEAVAETNQRFDRMDTNHDGKLDRTDVAKMREMRRERRGDMDETPPPPPPGE